MIDYQQIERQLARELGLRRRAIAIAFLEAPPAGVAKFAGTAPSGCTFWKLTSEGRTFYTVPGDHYNCAIGSDTHNIGLPPERAKELEETRVAEHAHTVSAANATLLEYHEARRQQLGAAPR